MFKLNLQLFAEESTADIPLATETEVSTEGSEVDTGTEEDTPLSFDDLLESNPEYKEAFGVKVKEAVDKRFKNQKNLQKQLDQLKPGLDILAQTYGLEASKDGYDYAALMQKVMDDDKMYEAEAFARGMKVEDYKTMKRLEVENNQLKALNHRQEEEAANREAFEKIFQEGEQLKSVYPSFELETELSNPAFGRLLANGVDVKTAFEVIHKDEILAGGMQYAVQQTKEKMSKAIQSGMTRPQENGISGQSTTTPGEMDPSKLTLAQIHELTARAQAGERITFQ